MEPTVALELKGISKHFGSVVANKNVDLTLHKGEILAILGENGSGKTTLMNMISGIYLPDTGKIFVDGKEAYINSPQDAFKYQIGMIHQHFKLIDVFTVAQNVVLGIKEKTAYKKAFSSAFNVQPKEGAKFFEKVGVKTKCFFKGLKNLYKERQATKYNIKKVNQQVKNITEKYGFQIDAQKKIYDCSVSEKQTVEIIKVLYRGAQILILDEPTAVLTPQETQKLFAVLRKMKEDGKSIIIITHKMHEVLSISDRVSVLRKGEYVGSVETAKTTEAELTEMMVGKKISLNIDRTEVKNPSERLTISNVTSKNRDGVKVLDNISFVANGGEILGIAGIAGSGQRELLEAIAGLQKMESGDIIFRSPKKDKPVTFYHKDMRRVKELANAKAFRYENGETVDFTNLSNKEIKKLVTEGKVLFKEDEIIDLKGKSPLEIRELGIRLSFVPEDRLGMGLVGNMDIVDNMMLRSYRKGHSVFVDRKKPENLAKEIIDSLEVVTPNAHTPVRRLSGGNVQKILVGREIASSPSVLMAAYPVRGLDINSSYMIYNLLNKQKERGTAVIFVGEDLDVLLALCDRILVIAGGKISGIVDGRTATKEEVGLLMTKTQSTEVPANE